MTTIAPNSHAHDAIHVLSLIQPATLDDLCSVLMAHAALRRRYLRFVLHVLTSHGAITLDGDQYTLTDQGRDMLERLDMGERA